jgi:uncharacterized membrane protein YqjE
MTPSMNDRAGARGYGSGGSGGSEEPEAGVFRGLIASVVDAIRTRLDLAAVEIEMYLLRVLQLLLWAVGAVACAVLALMFGLGSLLVALWDTHRLTVLLGGTGLFIVLSAVCATIAVQVFRHRQRLLEGTLQQLEHDHRQARGRAP